LKSAYINGENFIVTSIFNFFLGALALTPPYIASPPVPVAPNSNPFSMPAWLHQARSLRVGKKKKIHFLSNGNHASTEIDPRCFFFPLKLAGANVMVMFMCI